jgi:hypothetical protein
MDCGQGESPGSDEVYPPEDPGSVEDDVPEQPAVRRYTAAHILEFVLVMALLIQCDDKVHHESGKQVLLNDVQSLQNGLVQLQVM